MCAMIYFSLDFYIDNLPYSATWPSDMNTSLDQISTAADLRNRRECHLPFPKIVIYQSTNQTEYLAGRVTSSCKVTHVMLSVALSVQTRCKKYDQIYGVTLANTQPSSSV